MRVFISYGGASDQVHALRLQALAAVNGLTVFVPPAYTRANAAVPSASLGEIANSDVVLGVVSAGLTEACRSELNKGLELAKHVIVMSHPNWAPVLQPVFLQNLVLIDPAAPDKTEMGIVRWLKAIDAEQDSKTALLALGTLALGLLIFTEASTD